MKSLWKSFAHRPNFAAVFLITAFFLFPSVVRSQAIDNCSSGVVDSENGIEQTVCIYGDGTTWLTASGEVDAELTQMSNFNTWAAGVGLNTLLDEGNTQEWVSGDQQDVDDNDSSVTEEDTVTPDPGATYYVWTYYDELLCQGGDFSCPGDGSGEWSSNEGLTAVATTPAGYQGFINPKYIVVGVTYAPPGGSSYVTYTDTTSVGSTTTIRNSFSNDAGFSVSMSGGGTLSAGWFNGGFTVTPTESTDYTQGSSSSTTTTINKASTISYKTDGTPTEAPVSSDYDYFWIWVNPELFVTYTPPVGSTPGSVVVTGDGMDPNDPVTGLPQPGVQYTAGPDVLEIQVGSLNGDLQTDSQGVPCGSYLEWSNGEAPGSFVMSGLLARSWQSTANGYYWPSGEQSGLSFNDVCQILTLDPLATTPSQCPTQNDYTLLNSLPSTTSDGRFSKIPYPPNPIQYPIGGGTEQYSTVQTNTQSVSMGNSTQIKQAFSVSEKFSVSSFFGLTSDSITFKESDTLIWNYSTLSTLTNTTTLTDALSITGPPDTPTYPGNEPVEFLGYQDNTFGTFYFAPVNYCPGSPSPWCTE